MFVFVIILLGNCHRKLTNEDTVITPMDTVLLNLLLILHKHLFFELEIYDAIRTDGQNFQKRCFFISLFGEISDILKKKCLPALWRIARFATICTI